MRTNITITLFHLILPMILMGQNAKNMNPNLFTHRSHYSVEETLSRIESQLKALNIPVFAKFDHQKNARAVNMTLRPTQVIVFGAPAVGTKLMEINPAIAIELPLRIAVWEDENNRVWAAFPQMRPLAEKYNLQDHPIIEKMQKLLEELVTQASERPSTDEQQDVR